MSLVTAKWTRSQRLRRTESCIALRHALMAMQVVRLAAPAASAAETLGTKRGTLKVQLSSGGLSGPPFFLAVADSAMPHQLITSHGGKACWLSGEVDG